MKTKINIQNSLYEVKSTSKFNNNLKKISKQNKNLEKLIKVVELLANAKELPKKYRNHKLINDKNYQDCYECHIAPDWLLIYKIQDDELILLLFATGSHAKLFDK